jgi:hypothetical protein
MLSGLICQWVCPGNYAGQDCTELKHACIFMHRLRSWYWSLCQNCCNSKQESGKSRQWKLQTSQWQPCAMGSCQLRYCSHSVAESWKVWNSYQKNMELIWPESSSRFVTQIACWSSALFSNQFSNTQVWHKDTSLRILRLKSQSPQIWNLCQKTIKFICTETNSRFVTQIIHQPSN